MNNRISRTPNDVQDRTITAWKKLCDYVDELAESGHEEFAPFERLGQEFYLEIHTLPESISKLKRVKKFWLYGSNLKRIPPEIGQMESLEYFDPYTSYDLHWLPYEIVHCKNLKDSRVSTRALYGNFKNRMDFPSLKANPVRYSGDIVHCSVCKKAMTYSETNQLWITLKVATDILPLLVNLCSKECESKLPPPPKDYVQVPHKGGSELEQPKMTDREYMERNFQKLTLDELKKPVNQNKSESKLLKLVRKIWEK